MSAFAILMLFCGLFWTATYLLIIYKGFKDKSFGMPLAALCANISWEFIFAFAAPLGSHSTMQTIINIVWFSFDLVIIYQYLKYGPADFGKMPKWLFYSGSAVSLAVGFAAVYLITVEFNDGDGAYAAFGQNLMMSILFVAMLLRRKSLKGQSLWTAVTKCLGTAFSSAAFWIIVATDSESVLFGSKLMPLFFVATAVFDVAYIVLLVLVKQGIVSLSEEEVTVVVEEIERVPEEVF
jgi:hypothetical protein